MKHTYTRYTLFTLLLLSLGLWAGCKKDSPPVDDTIYLTAFLEDLDKSPSSTFYNEINDLLVGGTKVFVFSTGTNTGDKITPTDNVGYSFTLDTYTSFLLKVQTGSYSGTFAKSLLTLKGYGKANQLRIVVQNRLPTLYLNGTKLATPTVSNTGSGTGIGACPVGTWKTPTCNGAAGKNLIYYFGPLTNGKGQGYSENPDCNGVCTSPLKFYFNYELTGNTIKYTFYKTDPVSCNGTTQTPTVPTGSYSITYTCGNSGNQLVTEAVNTTTGVRTTLTFTRM